MTAHAKLLRIVPPWKLSEAEERALLWRLTAPRRPRREMDADEVEREVETQELIELGFLEE